VIQYANQNSRRTKDADPHWVTGLEQVVITPPLWNERRHRMAKERNLSKR
jgi:hypothetical protein